MVFVDMMYMDMFVGMGFLLVLDFEVVWFLNYLLLKVIWFGIFMFLFRIKRVYIVW